MNLIDKVKKIPFLKDSSLYVLGEIVSKMSVFLLLPYVSRKMGVENYGELSYYQTYISVFGIFLLLSQDGSVARYFYFYGKNSMNLIVSTGYGYTTIMGLLLLIGCIAFEQEMLAYAVMTSMFASYMSVQLSVRQCQKKAKEYIAIQFFSTLMSALATIFVLEFFTTDIVRYRIIGGLLANIVTFFVIYFFYAKTAVYKKFSIRQYKLAFMYIMGFGLPLILYNISGFLRGQIDRIFIYNHFSKADLGLYAMGANFALILSMLIMAVNKSTVPYYYEALKSKNITLKNIQKWFWLSLLFVPLPAIVVSVLPNAFFVWVLGSSFEGVKYYITMFFISASLFAPYVLLVNYLFYYGKNKIIALCSVINTVIYLLVLLALVFYVKKIEYIPIASIVGGLVILPILWWATNVVKKEVKN